MFLLALAFLAGHCLLHFAVPTLAPLQNAGPWMAAWATAAVVAIVFTAAFKRTRWCAALLCGIVWSTGHAMWRLSHELPTVDATTSPQRTDVQVEGYVSSIVEHAAFGQRFAFDVVDAGEVPIERIELTWYDAPVEVRPGERWRLNTRLKPRQGFANPGGYDYEAQLFRNGIGATGYVREAESDDDNRRIAAASWRYAVLQARSFVAQRIEAALPRAAMLGIVQGLAVGETQAMSSAQWRVFANTGTTHLMAISGLHIGMVAMLAAWLSGAMARRLPLQRWGMNAVAWQSVGGMLAALLYSALAGFSVPTQRTLAMLCVFFGMRLRRREALSMQSFGLALIVVLLIDPFAPMAPGFWLSFGAVAAIFLGFAGRAGKPADHRSRVADYVHLQLVVTVGMAPLVIGAFGSVSLISPIVNLVVIPLFTLLIVPVILLGSALASLHANLGAPLLQGVAWLLDASWPMWEWAAALPLALWRLPQLPWYWVLLLCAGCALCIAPTVWIVRVTGVVLCLPAVLWTPPRPHRGEFDLTLLDVGQGLAVVVRTANHLLLYDAGPAFRSGRDTGELVVLPYLYAQGTQRIDMLIASHGDVDHVGGMQSVLQSLPTSQVLAGSSVQSPALSQTTFNRCEVGQHWRWDGVDFAILHPDSHSAETASVKDNDGSCVLTIRSSYGAATIFGDVERASEAQLLAGNRIAPTEIVVVPHHGSRTSSTPALVQTLQARYALVGAGAGNRWGFPKPDVLARWQDAGATTWVTADLGAIHVVVSERGVHAPQSYRATRRRYWQSVPTVAPPAQ
jgi:competence protein ComEC